MVWACSRRHSGGLRAVKALQRYTAADAAILKAEFRTLSRCAHPHIVRAHRLVSGPGHCWFEMDRLHGVRITRWAETLGPGWTDATDQRFRQVAAQLVSAVQHVHALGWLHRDIKPDNLHVDDDDNVVLFDFDLAGPRSLDSSPGQILGTPGYRPPEQALGLTLGPAADWFSVGSVLYEMLTGHPPYGRRPRASLRAQRRGRPTALHTLRPEIPRDITVLVRDLIHSEPNRRPTHEQLADTFPSPVRTSPPHRLSRGTTDNFHKLLQRPGLNWIDLCDGTAGRRRAMLASDPPVACFDITVRLGLDEQMPHAILDAIAGETVSLLRRMPRPMRSGGLPRDRMSLLDAFPDFVLVPELSSFGAGRSTGAVGPLASVLHRLSTRDPIRLVLEDFHAIRPMDVSDLARLVAALPSNSAISLIAEGDAQDADAPSEPLRRLKSQVANHSTLRIQPE